MSTRTRPRMWAERNREDARLLAEGDFATLLATYYPVVLGRCRARLRSEDDAYEVAHRVIERLARELRSGRTYPVPYSVVVSLFHVSARRELVDGHIRSAEAV